MLPFHWRLGPFALSPVELTGVGGIVLVAFLARRRIAALGGKPGDLADLILAALVGGAVGSRLFYFLPLLLRGLESPGDLVRRWSEGSGFYGGLTLGTILVCATARWKRIPVLPAADAILARLPFGFALGKLGCFLAGCCYGRRCDGFPGARFAVGSLAQRTQAAAGQVPASSPALPVHPAQLYELAFGLAFPLLLLALERRSRRPGEVSLALYAGYSAWRFSIEFLRDDPGRDAFGGGLSDSQLTALFVLPACAVLWFLLRRRPPERRTSPVDGPTS